MSDVLYTVVSLFPSIFFLPFYRLPVVITLPHDHHAIDCCNINYSDYPIKISCTIKSSLVSLIRDTLHSLICNKWCLFPSIFFPFYHLPFPSLPFPSLPFPSHRNILQTLLASLYILCFIQCLFCSVDFHR